MNETYVECLVARKQNPLSILIKAAMIALICVLVILSLLGIPFTLIIAVVLVFLAIYVVFPMLDIEYEYLYLDKEITIDKIMSKQKRKKVQVLDLGKMELFAPSTSHEFDSYKSRNVKEKDFSSGYEDHKTWYLAYHDENEEALIRLEPDEEMIRAIRNIAPRKVRDF